MAGVKLDEYQISAINRMHTGCILYGGVGSGKSRTALGYYYFINGGIINTEDYYPMNDPPMDLYVITTARKRDTFEWESEMAPFLIYPDREHDLYDHKVVIDSWNNIGKYKEVTNAFFIFDEQRVVGSGAWVKSFLRIAKNNEWILLSATPGDSWSDYIPVFIANGYYRNRTEFIREHVIYKRYTNFPQIDRYINTGRLIRQRREILVDMDYEKPTISHHEDISVSYDVSKYKDVVRKRWNPYTDMPIENASEYCQVLRRIVNTSESRQLATLEIFEQHPKVIIFYNYDYELELLRELFVGKFHGIQVAEWNGHKHETIPDGGTWVYLVQYFAGAEGWNCTKTDTIIFYSQSYSYKTMVQASGRIDRRNTPYHDLWYYHLRSKSGIDLAISKSLKDKKQFNETKFVGKLFDKKWREKNEHK